MSASDWLFFEIVHIYVLVKPKFKQIRSTLFSYSAAANHWDLRPKYKVFFPHFQHYFQLVTFHTHVSIRNVFWYSWSCWQCAYTACVFSLSGSPILSHRLRQCWIIYMYKLHWTPILSLDMIACMQACTWYARYGRPAFHVD